jgi:hypothetical protein
MRRLRRLFVTLVVVGLSVFAPLLAPALLPVAHADAPTVTSLSPISGVAGVAGDTITLTGTSFEAVADVFMAHGGTITTFALDTTDPANETLTPQPVVSAGPGARG